MPPCSFFSVLHLLDVIAVLLGIVLLVVLVFALYVVRRNRLPEGGRNRQGGRRS